MRSGYGCTVQHALTAEAAGVVKQAVVLAKRRGHAQVTPLHVANTMLAASSGLFRIACLKSHSHPLQCKALELCFNVALNRLPASSSSSPILGPPHHHSSNPSISNALVAAFKRAQAHQRRGSIENQQQPILSVKIELEQLIISILDDPSVSRVMREAGFLSTQVKSNVEKEVSLELCTHQSSPPSSNDKSKELTKEEKTGSNPAAANSSEPIRTEDVNIIIETLLTCRRRKSLAIVGESISNLQTTVKGLMDRIDKGEVPDALKEVKFVSVPPLYSFCNLHREEVEQKIGELTCLVKSLIEKGVVLYLGDLKWISDYRVTLEHERGYYCSVEHMIMEIGRLIWGIGEIGRFWLMGIATFQTYMRGRNGCQSLETIWGLYPVTIPANSLGLSLASESERSEDQNRSCQTITAAGEAKFSGWGDCSAKAAAAGLMQTNNVATLSRLPSWLKDECSRRFSVSNDQNGESVRELCSKWNSFCSSSHNLPGSVEGTLRLSQNPNFPELGINTQNSNFSLITVNAFSSNPNSAPNSTSSSDVIMEAEYVPKFKEFNAENLNILCNGLERRVPWQGSIVQEIVGTVLKCRSGMLRRKQQITGDISDVKEETWLFFLGPDDAQAKEKISMELAKIIFGSYSSFIAIGSSRFSTSDECRRKRGRDEQSCIDRFGRAVSANPHRVFFLEDFDEADYYSKMGIKRAIERGKIEDGKNHGEEIGLGDAIVVLSSEKFGSCKSARASPSCSPSPHNGDTGSGEDETTVAHYCCPLDLNVSLDEDDDVSVEDRTADDLGILESVDRHVVFKFQL